MIMPVGHFALSPATTGLVVHGAADDCAGFRACPPQSKINIINTRRQRQSDMAPLWAGKFVRHGVSTKLQEVATQGMASRSAGNWPGHCQRRREDGPHSQTIQTERIATDGDRWCQKHPPPCPRQPAVTSTMDSAFLI